MHLGPDSVGKPPVLEPSTSGAAGAFDLHANDAPNRFAPGEGIAVYCHSSHRSTSSHRIATSRPPAVIIHSLTGCGASQRRVGKPRLRRLPRGCRGRWWGLRSLGLRRGVSLVQWLGLDSRRPRTRTARAIRTRKIRSRLVSLSFTVDT
jgi:N-acetylmuramoyl-L-alanine amidase